MVTETAPPLLRIEHRCLTVINMHAQSLQPTPTRGPGSKSVLLLDISRIIWRARRRSPTGIDRVELEYAKRFIAVDVGPPAYGVLHLFGFLFAVSPSGGRHFVEDISSRWQGAAPASFWRNLAAIIKIYCRFFASAWLVGPGLRRKLRAYPGAPVFLVVSHHHVSRGYTIERIRRSLGVKTACFLHDLIPIDCPEFFIRGWEERYHRIASNVGRFFDAVIVNSESTARSLRTCLGSDADTLSSRVTIRVAAPGVRPFDRPQSAGLVVQDHPYFVVLGTIEPRKNHLLLLNLWTRLASMAAVPPRLLVIGARGWENEQVVDMLERSRRLRGLVEEHNALSDSEVGALMHHARALLLPSFAEGFGLPLAEALVSGVPVICSDIPVFREVGCDVPEYLDPLDLPAWSDAVRDYCRPDSSMRAAQMQRLTLWRPPCWSDHFAVVEQLLCGLQVSSCNALSVPPAAVTASEESS
jgi:glycosyltransferase involved in cell wall biosynthesis